MNHKLTISTLVLFLFTAGLATQAVALTGRTLYVDQRASGTNDGTSWGNAYVHLEDAINAAGPGDEIVEADDVGSVPAGGEPADIYAPVAGMYWTDRGLSPISRANLDGSGRNEVMTGFDLVHGIAVDPSGSKMYWADVGPGPGLTGTINRSDLDGANIETLVTNLHVPRGVALDLVHGKLYWSDVGGGTKRIERANLDGTDREFLVVAEPYTLALDVDGGKMYWPNISNTLGRKIQRANLDGTDVEDLVTAGVYAPSGIALDVAAGKMYWTDQGTHTIQRANLDGTSVQYLVTTDLDRPFGIALHLETSRMYWVDWGEVQNIRRADFTGGNVEDLITTGLDLPLYIDILLCSFDADCDDGNPCTTGACDAVGECQFSFTTSECRPTAGPCDVAEFCTGQDEACPPDMGVPDGTPCPDDGNECTQDACNGGQCAHPPVPAGAECGDPSTSTCDNPDRCDSFGNCRANPVANGTPCPDDGSECTQDACNGGQCTHPPAPAGADCGDPSNTTCDNPDSCDSLGNCQANPVGDGTPCSDGIFCNGDEACAGGACAAGTPPCPPDLFCDEELARCVGTPVIPVASGWGLAIVTLLLLTSAKVYFGWGAVRGRAVTDRAK